MDEAELTAKIVVEAVVEHATMHFVEDQSGGQHDFDLVLPDGTLAALEVSSSADEDILSATAAIFDESAGGNPVATGEVQHVWIVDVLPTARIWRIRTEIGEYLAALESAGIDYFIADAGTPKSEAVGRLWQDLGVRAGAVYRASGPGRVFLQLADEGSLIHSQHVSDAVVRVALKEDSRRKLRASGATERHLFVYIHESDSAAWISLLASAPVADPTGLPAETTHVWAATHHFEYDEIIYWLGERTGWVTRGSVPLPQPAS